MTNRGAAVLGLRLFALYLVARVLLDLPANHALLITSPAALTFAAVLLPLLAAAAIWLNVGRVASWVLPPRRAGSLEEGSGPDAEGVAALAYAAVGLLLIGQALPPVLVAAALQAGGRGAADWTSPELLSAGLTVALGLLLVAGARSLPGLVSRLRQAGRGR